MVTNLEKYKADLDKLITTGCGLQVGLYNELGIKYELGKTKEEKAEFSKFRFKSGYEAWYGESIAVIKQILPDRLNDFIALYKNDKRKEISFSNYVISDYLSGIAIQQYGRIKAERKDAIPKFEQQLNIVKSLTQRFESSLYDIKQILQADLFDSEIDSAKELCRKGFLRAAGAICGVVIEKHLSVVCDNHLLKITKKNPCISDYNELLKNSNVIDTPVWRNIQRLADLRNLCGHQKEVEPTKPDVEELISGTDKVLKTIF